MNLTNILLGSTGVLLVVALFLSYGNMDKERESDPDEIAKLRREIERLETASNQLQRSRSSQPSLIFPNNYGNPSSPSSSSQNSSESGGDQEATNEKLESLKEQIEALTAAQETPSLEPDTGDDDVVEMAGLAEESEADARSERRTRLIGNAILQATVLEWSPEDWIAAIEPSARANFNVGDELALRRNGGILCYFTVTKEAGGAFIVALRGSLAEGAPEVVPGDELIIPPAFDGKLD
jgi:seryl-tRNA synthetase